LILQIFSKLITYHTLPGMAKINKARLGISAARPISKVDLQTFIFFLLPTAQKINLYFNCTLVEIKSSMGFFAKVNSLMLSWKKLPIN